MSKIYFFKNRTLKLFINSVISTIDFTVRTLGYTYLIPNFLKTKNKLDYSLLVCRYIVGKSIVNSFSKI